MGDDGFAEDHTELDVTATAIGKAKHVRWLLVTLHVKTAHVNTHS
jgi:hypothetical protein